MDDKLIATAETSIEASKEAVWKALTSPESIREYMFGANVKTDWKVGSPITWSGEFKGKPYEDKGEILVFDPTHELSYSHFSPLSGNKDTPDNYHKVTITLSAGDHEETRVRLVQDNNESEESRVESEKNWAAMLEGLKKHLENGAASSKAHGGGR